MISFLDSSRTITTMISKYRVWKHLFRISPLLIILLAGGLRFHRIDYQSLWNDEGNSLRLAERSISDLLAAARLDIHPPGYYLMLKGWINLVGESEFGLRSLSAFAGMLTVACVYMLGRALFSPGAGLVASLLVAINSFSVYYSQEARMYALLGLWAAASMLVFIRWIGAHKPTRSPLPLFTGGRGRGIGGDKLRLALLLALINAAGLYTQYAYPAVMVTQGILFVLWFIFTPKRDFRVLGVYIVLNLVTLAIFLPQAGIAIRQVTNWPRTGQPIGLADGLGTVTRWLVYGSNTDALPWWAYFWPAVFALAALLPDWLKRPQASWWRRLLPWLLILVSVGPFFALGLFRESNLKFLLPAQIAVALLIGRGIWLLWELGSPNLFIIVEAMPRLLAFYGLFSMLNFASDSLTNLYNAQVYARPDYRAMAGRMADYPRPGDAIILDAPNQQEVFTYYYHGTDPIYPLPAGLGGDDAATTAAMNNVIAGHQRIFVLFWGETERDPNLIVEKALTDKAFLAASQWYGDVRFAQYATLPPSSAASSKIGAQFGGIISLDSAALSASTLQSGDVLGITLNWSAKAIIPKRYKVFIHLLDSSGTLIAQTDSEPGNNLKITTTWQPDQPVTDMHGLLIPLGVPPGDYHLIVGLYDSDQPTARLLTGSEDHLELGTIHLVR